MKKSARKESTKSQNKTSKSKSNSKNSDPIPEPVANTIEDKTDNKESVEEKRPQSPFQSPFSLSRTNSLSASSSAYSNQNPFNHNQFLRHFCFGTGKDFISNNNPNKSFTESIFSLKLNFDENSILSNNNQNSLANKSDSTNFNNENGDDNEIPSTVLEIDGQTGEENEERLFDAPAILYRVRIEGGSSQDNLNDNTNMNNSNKISETPFFPTNTTSKKVQFSFQSSSIGRSFSPSTPLSSANMSRTMSAGANTQNDSNNVSNRGRTNSSTNINLSGTNKNGSVIPFRSNSAPAPKATLVEVGAGNLHLNKGDGFYRLVMRRKQVGKVCLNMRVFSDMKPKAQQRNYVSFIGYEVDDTLQASQEDSNNGGDKSATQLKYIVFKLRFKDEATQKDFISKLNDIIQELNQK